MGKSFAEACVEFDFAVDTLKWYGEEAKRAYGRLIPLHAHNLRTQVLKEPVGPAVAFVAWNFPATNFIRKVAGFVANFRLRRLRVNDISDFKRDGQ